MNSGSGGPSTPSADASATLLNTLLLQTALQQNPLSALIGQLSAQTQSAHSQAPQLSQQSDNVGLMNIASLLRGAQPKPVVGVGSGLSLGGDAYGNSALVGSAGDEEAMVKALAESENKGQTYRQALESLHGVNNHTASQWKDYYLDHAARINRLVTIRQGKPLITVKKPNFDSIKKDTLNTNVARRIANPPSKADVGSPNSSASVKKDGKESNHTPHKARKAHNVPDDIPSRSPTPPSADAVRDGRGYRYTKEERNWFVKYVKYRFSEDPHLKKADLCEELARKLPHHPASSWQAHWSLHRKDYDGQFATITGKELSGDEASELSDDGTPLRQQAVHFLAGRSDPASDEDTSSEDDRKNMSPARQPLSDTDKRVIARYIASHPEDEWDSLRGHERWTPFAEMFDQRDWRAWTEQVRRHKQDIDRLVRKYRQRQNESQSIQSQVAKPAWAAHRERSPSVSAKRPHSVEADGDHPGSPAAKRSRSGGSVPLSRASPLERNLAGSEPQAFDS